MSSPFGDYYLARYAVFCDQAEIRIQAQRTSPGEPRATEIVFSGVSAYRFEHDNFGTILAQVVEGNLEDFLRAHEAEFDAGFQRSGWPTFWKGLPPEWKGSVADALAQLQASSVRVFELTSSIGLWGWVLARDFRTEAIDSGVRNE